MKVERNKQIDGLRGIAMMMIVIYHLFFRYKDLFLGGTNQVIESMLPGIAVPAFMMLSSLFLDSYKVQPKLSKIQNVFHMILLKIKRLWPAYAISILIIVVVRSVLPLDGRGVINPVTIISNLLFVNGFIGIDYIDGAHWYLTALISATVVVALIVNLVSKEKKNIALFIWLIIGFVLFCIKNYFSKIIVGKIISAIYVVVGSNYIPIFILGIVINKAKSKRDFNIYNTALIVSSAAYILYTQGTLQLLEVTIAYCFVYLAVTKKLSVLENKVFLRLGEISYCTYLTAKIVTPAPSARDLSTTLPAV